MPYSAYDILPFSALQRAIWLPLPPVTPPLHVLVQPVLALCTRWRPLRLQDPTTGIRKYKKWRFGEGNPSPRLGIKRVVRGTVWELRRGGTRSPRDITHKCVG
jgi:hypothetical protein